MPVGNVSIQTSGGGSTLGTIAASGFGLSFLNPLYRYANLTLPYSPNDPGLSFTYDNSSLAPVVLLYARFFNLLNESSVPIIANVGTSAFTVSGGPAASGAQDCLDVRGFGAIGDGVADDTAAIQRALNQAYQNFLGNQLAAGQGSSQASRPVQSVTGHVENGSSSTLQLALPTTPVLNNTFILTFCAFDYGGGPTSPAPATVTDNRGNVWTQSALPVQNGEVLLYTYHAKVASTLSTTVTITMTQKNFNSFISAVLAEFPGIQLPITVDGTAPKVIDNFSFTPVPVLSPTNNGDLVIYAVHFPFAAGVVPTPPGDFTFVGAAITPQPNGLNGANPVTALAYRNWTGKTLINSQWTSPAGYGGDAIMVAFRQVPLPPSSPGKTIVCIPNGVSCMVSPLPIFDHNFPGAPWPGSSFLHNSLAYSLVMNDGVTLRIDGSIVANPNTNAQAITGGLNSFGENGWVIITNSAWLANKTIGTQLVKPNDGVTNADSGHPIIPWNSYIAGTAFNEGPRNSGIKITGSGKVYLNGQIQANLPIDVNSPPPGFEPMGFVRFICVDHSTIENVELLNPWSLAIQWGHSDGAKIDNLYIHDAPNVPGEIGTTFGGGIIEMDMLRNSKVTNNKILTCPRSVGILDFAGYQNIVSGNIMDNCYSGYAYFDNGGEWSWVFGPPTNGSGGFRPTYGGASYTNVTHNSEITQNKATNCVTDPPLPITFNQVGNPIQILVDFGSEGFGFKSGEVVIDFGDTSVFEALPVTGTGFHDNIANGNSTDAFFGPLTAFRSLANNSFGGGGTTVSNGVNTVTGEVPAGAINGTNKIFTLVHTPVSGSVVLFLNGLQQTSGTDFTVSGNTITLVVAPNSGSTLTANYQYLSGN